MKPIGGLFFMLKNEYLENEDHVIIFINCKGEKLECLVDKEDFIMLKNEIKNSLWTSKHHTGKYYVRFRYKNKKVLLHRFLLNPGDNLVVDHINLNPLDNRRINLRALTPSENKQNLTGARSDSETGIRGVSYKERDKIWTSSLRLKGKYIYLGSFKSKEDAELAASEGRKKYMPYSK